MKQIRICDLKNSTPIEQLLNEISKQTNLNKPDTIVFNTFVRTNYAQMFVDEIRRIFNRFKLGEFSADISDAYNFNEWFARIISGYRKHQSEHLKQVYQPANQHNNKLFADMWNESKEKQSFCFRFDMAVFGYELTKQQGKISNVDIERTKEFSSLKSKFINSKRDNGAILFSLDNEPNMNAYRNYCKVEIFRNYFEGNEL